MQYRSLEYLHSNMVRFIIPIPQILTNKKEKFTFQYGQIYYEIEARERIHNLMNLHSNMVRFIIDKAAQEIQKMYGFTFQYGQIYYCNTKKRSRSSSSIYIPIWLDLLFVVYIFYVFYKNLFTFQYGQIYYSSLIISISFASNYLHSNMVRFIINWTEARFFSIKEFTFQYGQIYYHISNSFSLFVLIIYIPIWLDLLFSLLIPCDP